MTLVANHVQAHPHIWIDSRVEVHLEAQRLKALRVHWTFDAFFTQMIIVDYGRPRNGTFSDAQIAAIREGAFSNLRHFGYFTSIRVDGRDVPVERVENFHTYVDDEDALVYQFDIPMNVDFRNRSREITVAMYDESFFTDMMFREEYIRVHGGAGVSYDTSLEREIYQVPIWGPMNRETVVIKLYP